VTWFLINYAQGQLYFYLQFPLYAAAWSSSGHFSVSSCTYAYTSNRNVSELAVVSIQIISVMCNARERLLFPSQPDCLFGGTGLIVSSCRKINISQLPSQELSIIINHRTIYKLNVFEKQKTMKHSFHGITKRK
jgi:hypothetical protein